MDGSGRIYTFFLPGITIDQTNLNPQLQPTGVNVTTIGLVTTPWSEDPTLIGGRREDFASAVAVNYTRTNQNFATNGTDSVLGRTIRSGWVQIPAIIWRSGLIPNYIPDGVIKVRSLPVRSAQSFGSAGMNVNIGDISLGSTQFSVVSCQMPSIPKLSLRSV